MSLPCSRIRTMRHAHCADTEPNSTIQHYHSVTSFLNPIKISMQPIGIIQKGDDMFNADETVLII